MPYTVQAFVADCEAITAMEMSDEEAVAAVEPLVAKLIARPDCLADLGGEAFPEKNLDIHLSDSLFVQAVSWKPGTVTPTHNHTTWAVIGVLRGAERNTVYQRKDDGSAPWRVEIEAQTPIEATEGKTVTMLPPNDIHSVAIGDEPALAVHVYGANINKAWRCSFDPETGEVRPFAPGGAARD